MPFTNYSATNYPANASDPIRRFHYRRAPLNTDFRNFKIGDEWLDETAQNWWKLCYKDRVQGIWKLMISAVATTESLVTQDAAVVGPDGLGHINVVGGPGVTTAGNPGTNTVTINLAGGTQAIDTITGNAGGAVPPDGAGNINIVGTATNGINLVGNPATFTLTASMQTPYADGDFEFRNTVVGVARTLLINNMIANVANHAVFKIQTEAAGGDAFTWYTIDGGGDFSLGIDNSDGDKLKLTDNELPSLGNEIITIDPAAGNTIRFNNAYTFPIVDGTANQYLATNGAGAVSWQAQHSAGEVVQYLYVSRSDKVTCSTPLPFDTSIPQQTEGVEVLTLTITPKAATNRLVIKSTLTGYNYDVSQASAALFQDAILNALAAIPIVSEAASSHLVYSVLASSVLARNYKIRAGQGRAGGGVEYVLNAFNTAPPNLLFGGVAVSSLEIWEIHV